MAKSPLAAKVASWRGGSKGFFRFLKDVEPQVKSSKGGYVAYYPDGIAAAEIARALDGDHMTVVFCWPRRHGKTLATCMIILWRFLTRQTENIAIVANSEKQVVDTAFRTIRECFQQTPFLKKLVDQGVFKVGADRIDFPAASSMIQAFPSNPVALWGKKLTAAQISELHAATGEETLEAIAGSLIDTEGSMLLIDSTVGPRSSPLFGLFQAAEEGEDETLFFSHIHYRDLQDACDNAPPWIDGRKLVALSRRMLPQAFGVYHLNRWQDGSANLFSTEIIEGCKDDYPLNLKAITGNQAYVTGAGIDRAFGLSKHGDKTFCCAVVKTVVGEDEHFFVMASDHILLSRLSGIKKTLTDYHRQFDLSRCTIETYNSQDVADWAAGQPFGNGSEALQPSRQNKSYAFTALYAAAAEGRLHIHPSFKTLLKEMETFEVTQDGKASDGVASIPKFQHAKGCHDDALHALAWAVHSLRDTVLNLYELNGIHCHGPSESVPLCVLNDGYLIPACAGSCRTMKEVRRLHAEYRERAPLVPMTIEEFVERKIANTGAHTTPR